MRKSNISHIEKIEAVEKYKRGVGSLQSIAEEYGVTKKSVQRWIANYEAFGPSEMEAGSTNGYYSTELKTAAVQEYLREENLSLC